MAPTRADIQSGTGKTRWKSEGSARYALASLRAQNPGAFPSIVRPYKCRACKRWHLGRGR